VEFLVKELESVGFNSSHIHRYTDDEMRKAYPALKTQKFHEVTAPQMVGIALGYHVQAIDMFVQTLPQKHRTYDYLWVLEDDVGYSGDIFKLLQKYSMDGSDLLGGSETGIRYQKHFHLGSQSPLFKKRVHGSKKVDDGVNRQHSEEHVQRISARLLGALHEWSVAGAIDMSETMTPTVCVLEKMKCSVLKKEDLGTPYTYWHTQAIENQTHWDGMVREDVSTGQPRLYHPVKVL